MYMFLLDWINTGYVSYKKNLNNAADVYHNDFFNL